MGYRGYVVTILVKEYPHYIFLCLIIYFFISIPYKWIQTIYAVLWPFSHSTQFRNIFLFFFFFQEYLSILEVHLALYNNSIIFYFTNIRILAGPLLMDIRECFRNRFWLQRVSLHLCYVWP